MTNADQPALTKERKLIARFKIGDRVITPKGIRTINALSGQVRVGDDPWMQLYICFPVKADGTTDMRSGKTRWSKSMNEFSDSQLRPFKTPKPC